MVKLESTAAERVDRGLERVLVRLRSPPSPPPRSSLLDSRLGSNCAAETPGASLPAPGPPARDPTPEPRGRPRCARSSTSRHAGRPTGRSRRPGRGREARAASAGRGMCAARRSRFAPSPLAGGTMRQPDRRQVLGGAARVGKAAPCPQVVCDLVSHRPPRSRRRPQVVCDEHGVDPTGSVRPPPG